MEDPHDVLARTAAHLYVSCCLDEDGDLDPSDHAEVVRRAYRSSDCDAFAATLAELTGWTTVRMSWTVRGERYHHALVRSPEGRLLDVTGWTDERTLVRDYRAKGATFADAPPVVCTEDLLDEDGFDEELSMRVRLVRALPWAPYDDGAFRSALRTDVPGVDVPWTDTVPDGP